MVGGIDMEKSWKFQLLILSAGLKPQSYPHVGTLNPKFQDWTRKKNFLLASAAVSGLAAAEDKNPKISTSDSECRDETPVVSTCRHTKSKVSGLNSEKKFCAGVSRSERLGCGWGQDIREVRTNGMMHWAAWLRLRTKIQNFEPGSFACSVRFLDRSPCPSIGFGVWGGNSEKVFLVLASTAVSGLAAAEDNNDSLKVAKETTEGSPRSGWGIRFGGRLVETAGVKMTQWHNHEIFNKSRLFRHFFQKYTFRYSK